MKLWNCRLVDNGNFLGTLQLLAGYDHILHAHLEMMRQHKKGTRLIHYLSPETQNEFISLCGERVLNTTLAEREASIYYSIIIALYSLCTAHTLNLVGVHAAQSSTEVE